MHAKCLVFEFIIDSNIRTFLGPISLPWESSPCTVEVQREEEKGQDTLYNRVALCFCNRHDKEASGKRKEFSLFLKISIVKNLRNDILVFVALLKIA